MRTHYQNLKVAEDAPAEVIRAAWRALSQQHHPDKNPGDAKAVQVMQILNEAYEVLSDPQKRRRHDEAIRKHRTNQSAQPAPPAQAPRPAEPVRAATPLPKERTWFVWSEAGGMSGPFTLAMLATKQRAGMINMSTLVCESGTKEPMSLGDLLLKLGKFPGKKKKPGKSLSERLCGIMAAFPRITAGVALYGVLFIGAYVSELLNGRSTAQKTPAYTPTKPTLSTYTRPSDFSAYAPPPPLIPAYEPLKPVVPAYIPPLSIPAVPRAVRKPAYIRPMSAPNGRSWPSVTGYLPGYAILADGSYCEVTVDNTLRTSDVHVKIVALPDLTVRNCFIQAGRSFTMGKLEAGNYEIRYRDLDTGQIAKSEVFELQVINNGSSINYSTLSLTLYTVRNGNTHLQNIDEDEF